jgi:WD40 repeat protein
VTTASNDDGYVRVWSVESGQIVHGPFPHPGSAVVALLDPSERILATSCGDGRVRLWDLQSEQQFGPDLVHGDMAVGLSFSSDGRRLATGSLDGTARIWDVPQPAAGTPDEIERRIQRGTGMRLTDKGDIEFIDANSWLQLKAGTQSTPPGAIEASRTAAP